MSWVVTCSLCGQSAVYERGHEVPDLCPQCSEEKGKKKKAHPTRGAEQGGLLAVGVSHIPGKRITKSLGLVNHEVVLALKLPEGGRPNGFKEKVTSKWAEEIRQAREASIRSIFGVAVSRGGNGVIGVSLVYRVLASNRKRVILLLAASGTAVVAH